MTRSRSAFVAILAVALCVAPFARTGSAAQRVMLDDMLTAYQGGDYEVVSRSFVRSLDFQSRLRIDKPQELERWLGTWTREKSLFLLEVARTSARVAPQYVFVIVGHGRRYLATSTVATDGTSEFIRMWHRAAMGLLQGAADPSHLDTHVADLEHPNGGPSVPKDARFMLARAVAQERRCWSTRPSMDQPAIRIDGLLAAAGAKVPDDVVGPTKSEREAIVARHSACLRETLAKFEQAATMEDVVDEARVRGGWTLIQDGRPKDAIEWLDAVSPKNDRDLEYWHGLFRGRALEALGRSQDAVEAFRGALALYPRAQSAGLGLALALMHLDRAKEADEVARSVREAGIATPDPWEHYTRGDDRFAGAWIDSLRPRVR